MPVFLLTGDNLLPGLSSLHALASSVPSFVYVGYKFFEVRAAFD